MARHWGGAEHCSSNAILPGHNRDSVGGTPQIRVRPIVNGAACLNGPPAAEEPSNPSRYLQKSYLAHREELLNEDKNAKVHQSALKQQTALIQKKYNKINNFLEKMLCTCHYQYSLIIIGPDYQTSLETDGVNIAVSIK